jgi:deoxyribonuclease V
MRLKHLHGWEVTTAEARAIQQRLAGRVRLEPLPDDVSLVAGADVAVSRRAGLVFAAVLVFRLPQMELLEEATAHVETTFPYVPGLLTFREGPPLVQAFTALGTRPDAVIFDGQGFAHPRRLGLATHMGLWLGLPTVGCAKSRLIGEHEEPGLRKGDSAVLRDGEEQIGVVLRTRDSVKPVFVSPGHLADFGSSERLVLSCCTRYRLPEPTRQAHMAVGRLKAQVLGTG